MENVTTIILYHNVLNHKIVVDNVIVLVEGGTWADELTQINGVYDSTDEIKTITKRYLASSNYRLVLTQLHWLNTEMHMITKIPLVQMAGT